jgi:hypothetical protein
MSSATVAMSPLSCCGLDGGDLPLRPAHRQLRGRSKPRAHAAGIAQYAWLHVKMGDALVGMVEDVGDFNERRHAEGTSATQPLRSVPPV